MSGTIFHNQPPISPLTEKRDKILPAVYALEMMPPRTCNLGLGWPKELGGRNSRALVVVCPHDPWRHDAGLRRCFYKRTGMGAKEVEMAMVGTDQQPYFYNITTSQVEAVRNLPHE